MKSFVARFRCKKAREAQRQSNVSEHPQSCQCFGLSLSANVFDRVFFNFVDNNNLFKESKRRVHTISLSNSLTSLGGTTISK